MQSSICWRRSRHHIWNSDSITEWSCAGCTGSEVQVTEDKDIPCNENAKDQSGSTVGGGYISSLCGAITDDVYTCRICSAIAVYPYIYRITGSIGSGFRFGD